VTFRRALAQPNGLTSATFRDVRSKFTDFLALGQLPPSDGLSPERAQQYEEALKHLPKPTGEEAAALVDLLPGDETTSFGLAWTLVHTIESSPDWPVWTALDDRTPWRALLLDRAQRFS
jgi:hypothetical protein